MRRKRSTTCGLCKGKLKPPRHNARTCPLRLKCGSHELPEWNIVDPESETGGVVEVESVPFIESERRDRIEVNEESFTLEEPFPRESDDSGEECDSEVAKRIEKEAVGSMLSSGNAGLETVVSSEWKFAFPVAKSVHEENPAEHVAWLERVALMNGFLLHNEPGIVGDCLYLSVVATLRAQGITEVSVRDLRMRVAQHMMDNEIDYRNLFVPEPLGARDFDVFCARTATGHEYGTELCLKALAAILGVRIRLISSGIRGEAFAHGEGDVVLHLAYNASGVGHYFALLGPGPRPSIDVPPAPWSKEDAVPRCSGPCSGSRARRSVPDPERKRKRARMFFDDEAVGHDDSVSVQDSDCDDLPSKADELFIDDEQVSEDFFSELVMHQRVLFNPCSEALVTVPTVKCRLQVLTLFSLLTILLVMSPAMRISRVTTVGEWRPQPCF